MCFRGTAQEDERSDVFLRMVNRFFFHWSIFGMFSFDLDELQQEVAEEM